MKRELSFVVILFCLFGCTANTIEPKAVKGSEPKTAASLPVSAPSSKSKISTVKEVNYFNREKITSSVEKIISFDGETIYKSNAFGSEPDFIEVKPGAYKVQFRCDNNGKYNYNWIVAKVEEKHNYVVYCLKETEGKTIFGLENIVSFFPFFSLEENLEKDMVSNQKIVDTPSQEILDKPVAEGKTRLIIYNVKSTLLGFDNSNSYKIFINGSYFDSLKPHKYIAVDVKNGETNIEISFVDVFTFKKNVNVNLDGGVKYVACSNGASSASVEVKPVMPEDFKKIYKPQYPFKP